MDPDQRFGILLGLAEPVFVLTSSVVARAGGWPGSPHGVGWAFRPAMILGVDLRSGSSFWKVPMVPQPLLGAFCLGEGRAWGHRTAKMAAGCGASGRLFGAPQVSQRTPSKALQISNLPFRGRGDTGRG